MIADKHRLELNPTEFAQLLLEKKCVLERNYSLQMSSSKLRPKFSIPAFRNILFLFIMATKEHQKNQEATEVNLDGEEPRLIK